MIIAGWYYSVTNAITDCAIDTNSKNVKELADVLGTLLADLKARGAI